MASCWWAPWWHSATRTPPPSRLSVSSAYCSRPATWSAATSPPSACWRCSRPAKKRNRKSTHERFPSAQSRGRSDPGDLFHRRVAVHHRPEAHEFAEGRQERHYLGRRRHADRWPHHFLVAGDAQLHPHHRRHLRGRRAGMVERPG